jgi:hypothetical protein
VILGEEWGVLVAVWEFQFDLEAVEVGPGEETGFLHAADEDAWGDADLFGEEFHFEAAFGAVELNELPGGGRDQMIGCEAVGFFLPGVSVGFCFNEDALFGVGQKVGGFVEEVEPHDVGGFAA